MTKSRPYKHPQVNLRIPQELKDKIEEAAKDSGRSMNAEICARLEQSLTIEDNGGLDASKFARLAFLSGHEVPESYKEAFKEIFGINYSESGDLSADYLIGRLKSSQIAGLDLSGVSNEARPFFEEARRKYLESLDNG